MEKLNIFEKLNKLVSIICSSNLYIIALLVMLAILTLILIKKNNKIFVFSYFSIIFTVVLMFHTKILQLFDHLVDLIFSTVYFPRLDAYIIILLVTNIIMFISLCNKKIKSSIKKYNLIMFSLIMFLSFLSLSMITKQNINVYQDLSIFLNSNLLITIELASISFVVWIISLVVIKIIDKLTNQLDLVRNEENINVVTNTVIHNIDWVEAIGQGAKFETTNGKKKLKPEILEKKEVIDILNITDNFELRQKKDSIDIITI